MTLIIIAVIIIIVIFIIVYISTRRLPPALVISTTCKINTDCAYPKTCNVSTSICEDTILPGLLLAAQQAANLFYTQYQNVLTNYSTYTSHVKLISSWYVGLESIANLFGGGGGGSQQIGPLPSFYVSTFNDIENNIDNLKNYYNNYLYKYYTLINEASVSSVSSNDGVILSTNGQSLLNELLPAIASFPTTIANFKTMISSMKNDYKSNITSFPIYENIVSDVDQIQSDTITLTSLAINVAKTSGFLKSHFISY